MVSAMPWYQSERRKLVLAECGKSGTSTFSLDRRAKDASFDRCGGGEDDRRYIIRPRLHRYVACRQGGNLGVDLLRHRALEIGLDHAVLFRDDEPGRFALPGRLADLLV